MFNFLHLRIFQILHFHCHWPTHRLTGMGSDWEFELVCLGWNVHWLLPQWLLSFASGSSICPKKALKVLHGEERLKKSLYDSCNILYPKEYLYYVFYEVIHKNSFNW